jgi:hypothetical protein
MRQRDVIPYVENTKARYSIRLGNMSSVFGAPSLPLLTVQ